MSRPWRVFSAAVLLAIVVAGCVLAWAVLSDLWSSDRDSADWVLIAFGAFWLMCAAGALVGLVGLLRRSP